MIGTSNRQWVGAAAAAIACGAAVWLAAPSGWLLVHGAGTAPASDAGHGLSSSEAVISTGNAGAMPSDAVAAGFEPSALDDAQRTAEGELAASRAALDDVQLRPEAMIAEAAGGRYSALDVNARPPAPPAPSPR